MVWRWPQNQPQLNQPLTQQLIDRIKTRMQDRSERLSAKCQEYGLHIKGTIFYYE